jgi:hypothetical protein
VDRPPPPHDPPAGCIWQPAGSEEDFLVWRVGRPGVEARRCRQQAGKGRRACGRPAVAELRRSYGSGHTWWAYCEAHLYGRWIENGRLLHWRLVEEGASR